MIYNRIEDIDKFAALGDVWAESIRLLKESAAAFEPGKTTYPGGIKFNCTQYETKGDASSPLEAHRQYADIQYIVEGDEICYVADVDRLNVTKAYDPEKDVLFGTVDTSIAVPLHAGEFCVFFPEDAHGPGCVWETPSAVKKIVVKVPLK